MSFLTALGAFNYGLVLIYGLFLSAAIAGGWENRRQKRLIIALCPLFLLIQTPCWLILGVLASLLLRRGVRWQHGTAKAERLSLAMCAALAAGSALLLFRHYFVGPVYVIYS